MTQIRLHTTRYHGPRHKPRITHDELRNETHYPTEIQAEIDAHDRLVSDIREYVADCVERGETPDGFAFAITYKYRYGDVAGDVIDGIIEKEMKRIGND